MSDETEHSNRNNKVWDHLWLDVNIATMEPLEGSSPTGCIEDGAIATVGDSIAWIGKADDLPPFDKEKTVVHLAKDTGKKRKWITPGLIDCHTHLIFAGDRSAEHQQRQQGVSYETIARQGGGINSTVTATRSASFEQLYEQAKKRALGFFREGVTTIEIKSGYGLDTENELKILRVARQLDEKGPQTVMATFLGAHAIPPEYKGKTEEYIGLVCSEMIPEVARLSLASSVDVFCENIAFNVSQSERVFQAAVHHGLRVKMHGDQLSNSGASPLAAKYNALSVDHLEFTEERDVVALKKSQTIAVLLPGAFYFLKETQKPPIALLRKHALPI
ncbi:MAG: imidazolonepropionase, partial [Pseudomonadales bacterium]|nr:imidazolonepropionase [Pseudomonadales bacterium]